MRSDGTNGSEDRRERGTKDTSGDLVVVEVRWERKSGNPWLLRELFDLLLRDPDLTDRDAPLTMEPEAVVDEEGGGI